MEDNSPPKGCLIPLLLLLTLFIGAIAWRFTHPQPKEPPRELTQSERASQALALAGVAAAGNPSTAIYTPLLLGAAVNAKEQEGDTTNAVLHPAN